jgi:hypothetical protein
MQTEGAFNPIPILVHALAIAAGLLVGWIVMDRIAPDFPSADPGLESSSAPGAVDGNDPDSLFLANNMAVAMVELQEQLGADQGILRLHIEPGAIDAETSDIDGTFDLPDVPVAAPARIAAQIHDLRPQLGLAQIRSMDLVATASGPRWYVQIDTAAAAVPPPWTYSAPLEGTPVTAGGAPPQPVAD